MPASTPILVTEIAASSDGAVEVHVDRITLQKRRWRADAEDGTPLAVDLPEAAMDGTVLESEGRRFVLRQSPEDVVVIPLPETASMAAKIGWYLGNRHIPIEVREDEMLVEKFPTLTDSLDRIGIGYTLRSDVLRVRAHNSAHRH